MAARKDAERERLAAALAALDWSQAELARRLGLHVNTVSGWATGKIPVPKYALAYLDMAVRAAQVLK